ncbi:hypothetical protein HEP84_57435 [Streptomyces sp. RLB1-33]
MFRHGTGPVIGNWQAVATSWVSQASTTSSAPAAAAMFASSAMPVSASLPGSVGRTQIRPTNSPRTSGMMTGRGTAPSASPAAYALFIDSTSASHVCASMNSSSSPACVRSG